MKIEIKNRYTNKIILCGEYESVKECLEKNRTTNLYGASLYGASLDGANLYGANLSGAYLSGASLDGANLYGANLSGANLYGANLYGAYLSGANLSGANLDGANLSGAYLSGANLSGANLYGANLYGANLDGAYLSGAKNYYNSHEFAIEIIRRQNIDYFSDEEWAVIAKIFIHRLCWDRIMKYKKSVLVIFKKLADLGFDEYLKHLESQ